MIAAEWLLLAVKSSLKTISNDVFLFFLSSSLFLARGIDPQMKSDIRDKAKSYIDRAEKLQNKTSSKTNDDAKPTKTKAEDKDDEWSKIMQRFEGKKIHLDLIVR